MNSGTLAKFILIALVFLLLSAGPAYGAGFTANDHATLVTAINSANGNSEADTITIEADITLTADLPAISTYIAFISSDGNRFTISGNNARRIFTVTSGGRLAIHNLVLANGNSGNDHGGAIHVTSGELELVNAVVRNSTAGTSTSAKSGGGIYVTASAGSPASASITASSIHNNLAYHEGGGIFLQGQVALTLFRSAVYSNESKSTSASGGGLVFRNYGDTPAGLTIVNSSIFSNKGAGRGAGIYASLNATAGITSVVNLQHVTITGNTTSSTDTTTGAGFYAVNAKVTLQNSIIHGNKRNSGSADSNCIFDQIPASGGYAPTLSNNIVGPGSTSSSAPHCTPNSDPADPLLAGPGVHGQGNFFIPRVGSPAIDSIGNADCLPKSAGGHVDQRDRARPFPTGGNCDKGAIEDSGWSPPPSIIVSQPSPSGDVGSGGGSGGGSGDGSDDDDDETLKAVLAKPVSTCLTLDGIAAYNINESTQCQRVNAMQIANPNIKEGDFVDAVDVWSWVTPNTQICFEAAGAAFKFIDTAAMPRTVQAWAACSMNGMTCATINGPGMLVLLPGDPPAACVVQRPAAQAAPVSAQSLSNCMVRTQFILNLRAAPDGEIIGEVPHNSTLTALQRTAGWFKVDYHGERGWIAAEFVDKKGSCG